MKEMSGQIRNKRDRSVDDVPAFIVREPGDEDRSDRIEELKSGVGDKG